MKDLTVMLPNRPGALSDAAKSLADAGVNIEGFCAFAVAGGGIANILVEDAERARSVLEGAGFPVRVVQDVLVVDVKNEPGQLGDITDRIAKAEVNLAFAYMATDTRLVLGAEDVERARGAL